MLTDRDTRHSAAPRLRFRTFWLALGWCFVGGVIYLSLTSDPPELAVPQGMKIGHCLAYAWLMTWFAQIFLLTGQRLRIACALAALGILLEYAQGWTDYRNFEYSDMLINASGVAVGLLSARPPFDRVLARLESIFVGAPS
jgi:VanZ family protein